VFIDHGSISPLRPASEIVETNFQEVGFIKLWATLLEIAGYIFSQGPEGLFYFVVTAHLPIRILESMIESLRCLHIIAWYPDKVHSPLPMYLAIIHSIQSS
jgi:hypothetical protein